MRIFLKFLFVSCGFHEPRIMNEPFSFSPKFDKLVIDSCISRIKVDFNTCRFEASRLNETWMKFHYSFGSFSLIEENEKWVLYEYWHPTKKNNIFLTNMRKNRAISHMFQPVYDLRPICSCYRNDSSLARYHIKLDFFPFESVGRKNICTHLLT